MSAAPAPTSQPPAAGTVLAPSTRSAFASPVGGGDLPLPTVVVTSASFAGRRPAGVANGGSVPAASGGNNTMIPTEGVAHSPSTTRPTTDPSSSSAANAATVAAKKAPATLRREAFSMSPAPPSDAGEAPPAGLLGARGSSVSPSTTPTATAEPQQPAASSSSSPRRTAHSGDILREGGFAVGCFTLGAATLGSGNLAMPEMIADCGAALAGVMVLATLGLTVYSVRVLVILMDRTGVYDFSALAAHTIGGGKRTEWFMAFCIFGFCFGCSVLYVRLVGDVLHNVFVTSGSASFQFLEGTSGERLVMIAFWFCFMLPMSLPQDVSALRYGSAVGVAASLWVTFAVFASAFAYAVGAVSGAKSGSTAKADIAAHSAVSSPWFRFTSRTVAAMPTMVFLFASQPNAVEVYRELQPRTNSGMNGITWVTYGACTFVYLLMGWSGYYRFGDGVNDGNVLLSFANPWSEWYVLLSFFALAVALTMSYPMSVFPVRDAIAANLGYADPRQMPPKQRMLLGAAISTAALLGALFAPSIAVLFDLLGGIFGSLVCFILPGTMALRSGGWKQAVVGREHVVGVWLMIVVGVIVGVVGTITGLVSHASSG